MKRTMDPKTQISHRQQLKTPDGTVYGPVDLATLCLWATDARVIPGCLLSHDGQEWVPVETVPEFRLNWTVRFEDGTTYGPLNLLAIRLLADEQSIPRSVTVVEVKTGRELRLDEALTPVLIEECRAVMTGCGAVTSRLVEALRLEVRDRRVSPPPPPPPPPPAPAAPVPVERDPRYTELLAKLKRAENDLSINMNLVAETQRRLVADQGKVEGLVARLTPLEADLAAERNKTKVLEQRLREAESDDRLSRLEVVEREHAERCARLEEEKVERDRRVEGLLARLESLEADFVVERNRGQMLERRLGEAEAEAGAVTHDRKLMEVDLASTRARIPELEAGLESVRMLLADEQGRLAQSVEAVARLTAERDEHVAALEAVKGDLRARDTALRQHEAALADQRADTARQLAEWQARHDALQKALELSRMHEEAATRRIKDAREAAVKSHRTARGVEHKLRDELATLQRDLDGVVRAGRALKTATVLATPRQGSINWLDADKAVGADVDGEFEARFSRMTLPEKFAALQRDLSSSAEEKDSLRREIETVRGRFDYLQKESERKDRESAEKLAQIQKEVKTSAELLSQAMLELERRESQLRTVRKQADERSREKAAPRAVLEAEVVRSEVLGPAEGAIPEPEPKPGLRPGTGRQSPGAGHVLTGMEAQLQAELKHWELLKQKEGKGGVLSKLFRRREP